MDSISMLLCRESRTSVSDTGSRNSFSVGSVSPSAASMATYSRNSAMYWIASPTAPCRSVPATPSKMPGSFLVSADSSPSRSSPAISSASQASR